MQSSLNKTLKQLIFSLRIASFILFFLFTLSTKGQALEIPRKSPKASVSQMVGVCKIDLSYGRPSVKDRSIFGGLVPYNQVWRAGANEATVIAFDKAVLFQGKAIPKGHYALFMIPTKDKWTVILNKQSEQWGAYNYKPEEDMLRVEVNPKHREFTEECTFFFTDLTAESAVLKMNWENSSIAMKIETNTKTQTLNEIETKLRKSYGDWYNFSAAAQYHFYELNELEKALEYIDIAITLKAPNPSPWMLKSQILAKQGNYKAAIRLAKEAIDICKKNNFEFEIEENETHIKLWSQK